MYKINLETLNAYSIIEGYLQEIKLGKEYSTDEIINDLIKQSELEKDDNENTTKLTIENCLGVCVECDCLLDENNSIEIDGIYSFCNDCRKEILGEDINVDIIMEDEFIMEEDIPTPISKESTVYKMINTIIEKQKSLNKLSIPKDNKIKIDWEAAILCESAEGIESSGYKWWKKNNIDLDNIRVETIDLLHFTISLMIDKCNNGVNSDNHFIIYSFVGAFDEFKRNVKLSNITLEELSNDEKFNEYIIHLFKKITLLSLVFKPENSTNLFNAILELLFLTKTFENEIEMVEVISTVFKMYMIKNVLNQFRQSHGYKSGDYIKNWGDENNVIEDNEYVFGEIQKMEQEVFNNKIEVFEDTILEICTNKYNNIKGLI